MTAVYVVLRTDGEYSDASTSVHGVYSTLERAEQAVADGKAEAAIEYGKLYDASADLRYSYERRGQTRDHHIFNNTPRFEISSARTVDE
jgi:hypothetical protein